MNITPRGGKTRRKISRVGHTLFQIPQFARAIAQSGKRLDERKGQQLLNFLSRVESEQSLKSRIFDAQKDIVLLIRPSLIAAFNEVTQLRIFSVVKHCSFIPSTPQHILPTHAEKRGSKVLFRSLREDDERVVVRIWVGEHRRTLTTKLNLLRRCGA